uniref:3-hydroxyisobutyryl-CoA hydrolase, mitochondrial n=1 Tax=Culicoides sonorensis TaxID=179676 RepID=A0A336LWI3_CULSO
MSILRVAVSRYVSCATKQNMPTLSCLSNNKNFCTATDNVLFEEVNNNGLITINRPKALNAINLDMVRKIYAKLKPWEENKNLVVIKGAGEKSFCAGGDVRAIVEAGPTEDSKAFFREEYQLNALIGYYKKPYIAIIDGITMGGGVGLSVHGKYRVATERTLFAMPETAIGLFPDVGGGYFLPRLQGKLGLYLGLTGYRLKGQDVKKAGIATHYVDSSKVPELEKTLLDSNGNPAEVDAILKSFDVQDDSPFVLEKDMADINRLFAHSRVAEIIHHLKEEETAFSENTLKLLKKMSPTSLKVTKRQLDYGADLDLKECLRMEYRLAVHHTEKSDFKEGVRALLIDKDQNPSWNPRTIEEVTYAHVDEFFEKLPPNEELKFDDELNAKL